jgi:hypothetical protein
MLRSSEAFGQNTTQSCCCCSHLIGRLVRLIGRLRSLVRLAALLARHGQRTLRRRTLRRRSALIVES